MVATELKKKQYYSLDIVKIIMAVFVIIIHKPLFTADHAILNYTSQVSLGGLAVPFFFICSAFFFFSKIDLNSKSSKQNLLKFEKRMFTLYVIWTIIYLPCIFVKSYTGHYSEITATGLIAQALTVVKDFFLSASFTHFWYINTLMLSVFLVYLLFKKLSVKKLLAVCIAICVLSNILSYFAEMQTMLLLIYYKLYVPEIVRNTLEKGLVCVALGLYYSANPIKLSTQKSTAVCILLIAIRIALGIVRIKFELDFLEQVMLIISFFTSFMIFSTAIDIQLKPSPIYPTIRKYSSLIYFSHLLMTSEVFNYIANISGIRAFSTCKPLIFLCTLTFAVIFSTLIIWLQSKKGFSRLKYLY